MINSFDLASSVDVSVLGTVCYLDAVV